MTSVVSATQRRDQNGSQQLRESGSSQRAGDTSALQANPGSSEDESKTLQQTRTRSPRASVGRSSSITSPNPTSEVLHMTRGAIRRLSQSSPEQASPLASDRARISNATSPTKQTGKGTRSKMAQSTGSASGNREEKDGAGSVQSTRRAVSYAKQGSGKTQKSNVQSEPDFAQQLQYAIAVAQAGQTPSSTPNAPPNPAYLSQALAAASRQGTAVIPTEIMDTFYRNTDPRSVLQMFTTLQAFGVSTEVASRLLQAGVTEQGIQGQGVASNLKDETTQNPSSSEVPKRHSQADTSKELEPSPKRAKVSSTSNAPESPLPKPTAQNQCDVCSRTFSSASGLAKHKLTHSEERKFICYVCGRGFKRQDHLNSHALTHREKKPFNCTFEGCSKSYCDNRSLRRHLENHHANDGSRPSGTIDANQSADEIQLRSGGSEMLINVSSQTISNDNCAASGFPVQSLPESMVHLSTASPVPLISDKAASIAVSTAAAIVPVSTVQFPTTIVDEQHASKQWNETVVSSLSSTSQMANKNLGSKPPPLISAMQSTISSNFIPRGAPATSFSLSVPNIPQDEGYGTSSQAMALPPVYPHGTANEAYQSYLAAMARKKQEEQAMKPSESFPTGVGVGLDVKSIIQQPGASHELSAPVSLTSQWTCSPPACGPSTPAFNMTPFQPPSYAPPTSRYQYPLGANEPLLQSRPPLAASVQPTDAQLLAVLMAAAPPPPSPIFNVNNWQTAAAATALGMAGSPYLFQQVLAGLMHQAAASSPLHGLTSGMNYANSVSLHQPIGTSIVAEENIGQKKEGDSTNSTLKIPIKALSSGSSLQVQCPICERFFKNVKSLNGHMRLHGGYEGHKTTTNISSTTPATKPSPVEETATPFSALLKAVEVTKERELASEVGSDADSAKRKKKISNKGQEVRFCEEPMLVEQSPSERSHGSSYDEGFCLLSSEDDAFAVDDSKAVSIQQTFSGSESGSSSVLSSPCRPERDAPVLSPTPSLSDGSSARRRKRPENLVLKIAGEQRESSVFSNDETDLVHPTTPPPYTPPPILSPHITVGLLGSPLKSPRMSLLGTPVITPHSAITPGSSKFNIPWMPRRISTDQGGQEQEITLTPKINIGPQFQAEVPPLADKASRQAALKTKHRATKVWSPINSNQKKSKELDTYFELSRSGLVPFSGSNKEFAHHILFWCKGNIKAAVKVLLSGKLPLPVDHPMENYRYSGSSRWMRPDRQVFKKAWREHGKQFRLIHKALEGKKTVKEVIEYYYFWKKYCNNEYRGRTRRDSVEIDSEEEFNTGPPFECEFPGCDAAFPTRQGLNGHIRIHGGNFVYRIETRRARRDEKQRQRGLREPSSRTASLTPSPLHQKMDWDEEEAGNEAVSSSQSFAHVVGEKTATVAPILPSYATIPSFIGLSATHGHPSFLPLTISGALTDSPMLGVQGNFAHLTTGMMPSNLQGLSNTPAGKGGNGKRATGGRSTPTTDGKPEFKCKVCGRVFAKVKSRSAHMKIHSSRSDHY